MWREKGGSRNRLLELFVTKCYDRDESQATNKLKLEALVKFKQVSREFKKTMQGYSFLTETEMKEKNWNDAKIQGAKQYCLKKKLYKECPYEKVKKFLVLVNDDVQKLCSASFFLMFSNFTCTFFTKF